MKNHLQNQSSPYLLQHAENPVNWFPWCGEAFDTAKAEDKPIFLSIGYSTCHWCHVMAHESFEDEEVAAILNEGFISIKVDKEERPDIDNIYMSVCQAFTGSGGWPTSIFMTPDQKPFFAGTYFPKSPSYGMAGFPDLLKTILLKWKNERPSLLHAAEEVTAHLAGSAFSQGKGTGGRKGAGDVGRSLAKAAQANGAAAENEDTLLLEGYSYLEQSFDKDYGGFGSAPKFPSPHNLLFLMEYFLTYNDRAALAMAEKTLLQMYRGGLYDHVGYGFSRYSTDRFFLVPHFEKMLYDNALLMLCFAKAFSLTRNPVYQSAAKQTARYLLREMADKAGGFYCAQDADSEGVEGRYYVFGYEEILDLLGSQTGMAFNTFYGVTREGNFEGKNILNLLGSVPENAINFQEYIPRLYEYRKDRFRLHLDDKLLTSWNALAIAAFAFMYQVFGQEEYLAAAQKADCFIAKNLMDEDTLYVSWRKGRHSGKGFLDDYAFYAFALLHLYHATLEKRYLERARRLCDKAVSDFYDNREGGFYLSGKENEQLIFTPKETYDGAVPCGNSVMAYNLVQLSRLTDCSKYAELADAQLGFMAGQAHGQPAGHCFFLLALSQYLHPGPVAVCVLKNPQDLDMLAGKTKPGIFIKILEQPTENYRLVHDKMTIYICKDRQCLPPTNDVNELLMY